MANALILLTLASRFTSPNPAPNLLPLYLTHSMAVKATLGLMG
jgi:hypothetical protein